MKACQPQMALHFNVNRAVFDPGEAPLGVSNPYSLI